jgi:hypothetical protein
VYHLTICEGAGIRRKEKKQEPSMPPPAHIQAATLQKFLAGWKNFTAEEWMATWSADSRQHILPFSLGVPSRSRTEMQQILPKLIGVLKNYEVSDVGLF